MSTYLEIKNSVLRELFPNGSSSSPGLDTAVSDAILSSVRFYENDRFWFNEDSTAFVTSPGQSSYSFPTSLIKEDSVKLNSTNDVRELKPRTINWINEYQNTIVSEGIPKYYAIYAQQFFLYVTPDSSYTVSIDFKRKLSDLPGSSGGSSTNAWLTEGQDLIKTRTKIIVCENFTRDYDYARVLRMGQEPEFREKLDMRTRQLQAVGEIHSHL